MDSYLSSSGAPSEAIIYEQDVAILMDDGLVLRANVYRPSKPGRYPVVMSMGIYGKDVHFADAFPVQWAKLLGLYPGLCKDGSTGRFLRWENVDPERWVPDDFIVIAVDSRGSGKSPGYLEPFSPRETQDYFTAVEWAASQNWSNGKVGLIGVSYFAIKQWQVAALQPPHLAAMIPWEGASDFYREWSYHGGILSNEFPTAWWPRQVVVNQHGNADTPYRDRDTGTITTGEALDTAMLRGNRTDHVADLRAHPLDDAWHRERSPDFSRIQVPLLSAGNWGGPGVHLRGNVEGFVQSASSDKWLSMHVGTHFESFYLPDYVAIQKRFFRRFLMGDIAAWQDEPRVQLAIRSPAGTVRRMEHEWPLERTRWTRYYLDTSKMTLSPDRPPTGEVSSYDALGPGLTFSTAPFTQETEFTGPVAAHLCMGSSTSDLDVFATLRLFDSEGRECVFDGAHEPTPVTRGWLRASHRHLDPARTRAWRPYHSHDRVEPLVPSQIHELDVELWPTSIVVPPGYRIALTLQGCDFELSARGRIRHDHPDDRPANIFSGRHLIASDARHETYLLLPHVPAP